LRKSYYSSTSNNFTVTVSNAANGEITMAMTAANTANLTAGRMLYDLLITSPTSIKTRVVEGIATILPSVTR
jgi:phage-related minor tail protein